MVPIGGAEGVTFYPEVADFVCGRGVAEFVGDFCFESRKDFAAGAGLYFAGAVGDDHMQAFRGAEGVEDFYAEALAEAFEERRWQGFAGGNGVANAGEIEVWARRTVVTKQSGVICRDGEK